MNKGYTQKEVSTALNNAVAATLRPSSVGKWPESTIRCLRAYVQAMMEVPLEHMDEGLVSPEELVAILTCAAYYVQLKRVMKRTSLPGSLAEETVNLMEPRDVLVEETRPKESDA